MLCKTIHRKLKIEHHEPTKTTRDSRRITVKRHEHHLTWTSCWTLEYAIWSKQFFVAMHISRIYQENHFCTRQKFKIPNRRYIK